MVKKDIDKKIGLLKRDFVYICIMFTLVILCILSIVSWDKESASVGLNNAATAISIVLAVIAIIMSLVDVAGQRSSIYELAKSTSELQEAQEKFEQQLINIIELKDSLIETVKGTEDWRVDMKNKLESLIPKHDGDLNTATIPAEDLREYLDNLTTDYKFSTSKYERIVNYIRRTYNKGDEINISDIKKRFSIPSGFLISYIDRLFKEEIIKSINNEWIVL